MTNRRGPTVVGVDLGGTFMHAGVVGPDGSQIGAMAGSDTCAEEGPEAVVERVADVIAAACAQADQPLADIAAIGIAAPGAIDIPTGVVVTAPNLRWSDMPLRRVLERRMSRPVVVENDVNGALWGEYRLGAAAGAGDTLGVWVGTGVGGGLVLDGRLHHGSRFTAGEVGHAVITPDGPPDRRIVEDWCSRTGMARIIQEELPGHPESLLHEATDADGRLESSAELARVYEAGDPLAREVVDRAARLLGVAIANWVTVLAVDVVIVGGGVTEVLGEPWLELIRASFRQHVFPERSSACPIRLTQLETRAGVLGAALLAQEMARSAS